MLCTMLTNQPINQQDNPIMGNAEDKLIPILGLDVWEVGGGIGMGVVG